MSLLVFKHHPTQVIG